MEKKKYHQTWGNMTYNKLFYQVTLNVWQFARSSFPSLKQFPTNWSDMVKFLENYKPRIYYKKIIWMPPNSNTIKCNTDGAIKGNPGKSSHAYCLRDREENLIYAQAEEIPDTTNVEAEAVTIKETIYHCTRRGFSRVTIETDSLLLKNILQGN
ncbi:hypothetical protein KY290_008988 [Solanum tuberosum]|uniref:RNase H type-1 domain-containing protein n=1 Tax=Solanum tuberosum TaxID=4113 RepID=A0ABQ7W9Y6_SOLTU|nr:hypothetical protein KY289_009351 [Solanum tuberosum]KAH0716041.1 hypothetical protein KY284_008946 [Solanum tuberosum]KAH0777577.1 hypothetical protein KY290_008988 [Solanum tuberosum]